MDARAVLCVLGLLYSLATAVDKTVPPEDLDSSGDDEDFSGSGYNGSAFDLKSKDIMVYSTPNSTLLPTVEGTTAVQELDHIEEETNMEDAIKSTEATKTPSDIIEDLFALDTVTKGTTQEATTSPFQPTSTADLIEEIDTKKHHHHHHHHPHHHTTTSSTSLPAEPDGQDDYTGVPPEGAKPHGFAEIATTSTPDKESELHPQELTTPDEHLAKHGVHHERTTGSASTYTDNEVAVEPVDSDLSGLDTLITSTVAEESHTHKDHHPHHHPHHHHHHHHPHHTTVSLDGSDVQEVTTMSSDVIEQEEKVQGEPTTAVVEDGYPHHGHPHHTHHHKTTPSSPMSTEPEKPHEVHTHEPKGRRIHGPDVKSTTAVPVIHEDDAENDDFTSSTVIYNVSRSPFDEESLDSKEEGSTVGVPDEDIYIEEPAVENKMVPPNNAPSDDGSSDASHGIMERKELLAGIIAGGVAGLVFAAFLVAFVLYRMKKKDEGSYSLEEPKQSNGGYQKPREQREFYA